MAQMEMNPEFLVEELVLGTSNYHLNISDYGRLIEEYFMCLLVCNNISTVEDDKKGISYES